jgi:hypothetical protein
LEPLAGTGATGGAARRERRRLGGDAARAHRARPWCKGVAGVPETAGEWAARATRSWSRIVGATLARRCARTHARHARGKAGVRAAHAIRAGSRVLVSFFLGPPAWRLQHGNLMVPLASATPGTRSCRMLMLSVKVRAERRSGASEQLDEALIRQVRAHRVDAHEGLHEMSALLRDETPASLGRRAHRTSGFVRHARARQSGSVGDVMTRRFKLVMNDALLESEALGAASLSSLVLRACGDHGCSVA